MQRKDLYHLIQDEQFINYCFNRNVADVEHWENWRAEHPECINEIDELKSAVLLLGHQIGEQEAETQFANLSNQIASRKLSISAKKFFLKRFIQISAAAVFAMVLGFGFYLIKNTNRFTPIIPTKDIGPGSNQAVLILGDGSKINLNNAVKGVVASQAGIKIVKTDKGELLYDLSAEVESNAKIEYNTIEVPVGGQWQVLLPDQTKVWLNSQSRLTYPTRFSGKERKVKVSGEAYFEVAHNKEMPFKVETINQLVEVLGTHFNVKAYSNDEVAKTTLLEGSVKITNLGESKLLKPGQQAEVSQNRINLLDDVDTKAAVAWKNGYFMFNNTDLPDMMHQLSRWYGVEVVFEKERKGNEFVGQINRNYSLLKVLKILELSDVRFELKGKTIIVK